MISKVSIIELLIKNKLYYEKVKLLISVQTVVPQNVLYDNFTISKFDGDRPYIHISCYYCSCEQITTVNHFKYDHNELDFLYNFHFLVFHCPSLPHISKVMVVFTFRSMIINWNLLVWEHDMITTTWQEISYSTAWPNINRFCIIWTT